MHIEATQKVILSFKTKLIETNNDIAIVCNSDISNYANLCLTVDTGATHSIIKRNKIKTGSLIMRDSTQFNGLIKSQPFRSIAKIRTNIQIEGMELEHVFYVVPDKINLRNDGIIGTDFMKTYQVRIDYATRQIKFSINVPWTSIRSSKNVRQNNDVESKCTKERKTDKGQSIKRRQVQNSKNGPHNEVYPSTNMNISEKPQKIIENRSQGSKNERGTNFSNEKKNVNTNRLNQIPTRNTIAAKNVKFDEKVERFIYMVEQNENENREMQTEAKKPSNKPKTKESNPDFYRNLSTDYFRNYPKINLYPIDSGYEPYEIRKHREETEQYIQSANETFKHGKTQYEKQVKKKQIQILSQVTSEPLAIEDPTERLKFLSEKIDFSHCSLFEKQKLLQIFLLHHQAFQIPGDKFEHTNAGTHKIELKPGSNPVYVRQFRIPDVHKVELQRQIDDLEEKGIISKCQSPWNSPIFLVPKKNDESGKKQYRLVVDFRTLNKTIQPTSYPIPLIDEIIDQMHGCKLFSVIDLTSAFLQIP